MAISIQTITHADIPVVNSILIEAYNSPQGFIKELQLYLHIQPDGWFIVLSDGIPVGAGGLVNYDSFAYIGLIAILPSLQRRGIGQVLMTHILTWLTNHNCPVALLDASQAGAPLYTKLGFQFDGTTLVLSLNTPTSKAKTSPRVHTMQHTDIAELVRVDTPLFGADRQKVFSSYLTSYPDTCFVLRDHFQRITGCILAQNNEIGPWIAENVEDAETLLAHILTRPFHNPPRIRIPIENQQALSLAYSYGFSERRRFHYMRLGGNHNPQQRAKIYALTTPAIG